MLLCPMPFTPIPRFFCLYSFSSFPVVPALSEYFLFPKPVDLIPKDFSLFQYLVFLLLLVLPLKFCICFLPIGNDAVTRSGSQSSETLPILFLQHSTANRVEVVGEWCSNQSRPQTSRIWSQSVRIYCFNFVFCFFFQPSPALCGDEG